MALVEVERSGDVAVVTLRREAKLNALSAELELALGRALEAPEVEQSRALVLAGAGRAFSAGADLGELGRHGAAATLSYYRTAGAVYERVGRLPQPSVAAIHGYCLGGGLELALACDFRVVEETAVLGFPEVALGILPSAGGVTRLVRAVGVARAKELALLGDRLSAAEAREHGLVTEVVAAGEALGRAVELAGRLAALPPLAVTVTKEAIELAHDASREASLLIERLAYGLLAGTSDASEASEAFAEKREPRFEGR
jgi:enoyl-CoA hydratase/carnithine racemase